MKIIKFIIAAPFLIMGAIIALFMGSIFNGMEYIDNKYFGGRL